MRAGEQRHLHGHGVEEVGHTLAPPRPGPAGWTSSGSWVAMPTGHLPRLAVMALNPAFTPISFSKSASGMSLVAVERRRSAEMPMATASAPRARALAASAPPRDATGGYQADRRGTSPAPSGPPVPGLWRERSGIPLWSSRISAEAPVPASMLSMMMASAPALAASLTSSLDPAGPQLHVDRGPANRWRLAQLLYLHRPGHRGPASQGAALGLRWSMP